MAVLKSLEVYNGNSYIKNVGSYDGTNPDPGTNDVATIITSLTTALGNYKIKVVTSMPSSPDANTIYFLK